MIQTIENKKTLKEPIDPAMWVDLELLLTDAFMLYSSHLLAGRVNPETIHTDWIIVNPTADLIGILQSALRSNQIRQALNDFRPLHLGYIGLKNSLADYRKRAEKNVWSPLLPGKSIKKGKSGLLVRQLCERLTLLGDLKTSKQIPIDLFDESVEAAVRRFQKRHGLRSDGIVGPRTLAILNIPIRKRVRQIEINMERWRWIPRNLGNRYILVNVAEFNMWVTENRQRSLNMRVAVGRPFRRTPVFSSKMTYMVINPFWNIPTSIAVKDILPKIQKKNQYLDQQGIKVFENWEKDALELNPQTIDWKQIGPRNFFYRLRQDPGPQNALGRIKFMFPNKFAVYLHDTPKRFLFKETVRDFSSGCIRIEKPIDLAVYITRNDPRWTKEELLKAIAAGQRKVITLREPIAIHLQYWTAWVDDKGELHFRDDIYDRDNALDRALKERLPRM
ncbi:MAG: L,D-transpeptidase family protein [Desulfobacterales bacterium]|nr:MAG: L,D-transpeptidase family protein [Desulfobacterales bacterium]